MPQHHLKEYVLIDLYIWHGVNQGAKSPVCQQGLSGTFAKGKKYFLLDISRQSTSSKTVKCIFYQTRVTLKKLWYMRN